MATRSRRVHDEMEEGEVAAKHAQLQAAVARKRMREEIDEMEAELSGRRRPAGVSPAPSRSSGSDLPVRARALAPPVFTGKTLGELRRYTQGCTVYFDAVGEYDEARRVTIAASYLRDDALSQWMRLVGEKPTTWDEYQRALRDMIQDPASRMGDALLALKKAEQRASEGVRELANRLEEFEEDIPDSLTVEQQRAWTLLNALRSDLRVAVLREERAIHTRAQVVAAAQRLEILTEPREEGEVVEKARPLRLPGAVENRECYICRQRGHIAKHCPKKIPEVAIKHAG